jgi:hypothetical protein
MMVDPARYGITNPTEPVVHELPDLRYQNSNVPVRVQIRKAEDGVWRGRLVFGVGEAGGLLATAEIFCAPNERDLWGSIRDLRTHHLQDLYRSLVE